MGDAIGNAFTGISDSIIDAILNRFIQWLFKSIYDGIANFFTQISNMGTEIFDLSWVQAVVKLFSLFGWSLFVEVKRMNKDDIKRFLAIYFGASMQGELIPNVDGEDGFDEEKLKKAVL